MKNNILKIFLAVALILGSVGIWSYSYKAKADLPPCDQVLVPDPGVNCTDATPPTGGGTPPPQNGGPGNTKIATISSVSNDDGGTANVYSDFTIQLTACGVSPQDNDPSTINMNVFVDGTSIGTVGGLAVQVADTCTGNFRVFWANGNSYSSGAHSVDASGSGYTTNNASIDVIHHAIAAVSNSSPSVQWAISGGSSTSISCSGSASSSCSTSSMTPASDSVTLVVRGGTMVSNSISLLNKFLSKFINIARADGTYTITLDAGRTTTATLQADPVAQCSITFNINGNGSSSHSVGGASYTLSGPSGQVITSTTVLSVPGGSTYTVTNNSPSGPFTVDGVKAILDQDPSTSSVPCPAGRGITFTANYTSRAQLQVQ